MNGAWNGIKFDHAFVTWLLAVPVFSLMRYANVFSASLGDNCTAISRRVGEITEKSKTFIRGQLSLACLTQTANESNLNCTLIHLANK